MAELTVHSDLSKVCSCRALVVGLFLPEQTFVLVLYELSWSVSTLGSDPNAKMIWVKFPTSVFSSTVIILFSKLHDLVGSIIEIT